MYNNVSDLCSFQFYFKNILQAGPGGDAAGSMGGGGYSGVL